MIVYTKDDMLRLSGALVKNQWLTIKAAAGLLLTDHPEGIIIDCGELEHISEDGAKTFLDAMRDIQAAGARIVVANLPEMVLKVLRSVPGVRSQLPIAASVEEARASLRFAGATSEADRASCSGTIMVPLLPGLDPENALVMAARIARETKRPVTLVYLLQVARNLPLGTPLPELEAEADAALQAATAVARRENVICGQTVERVRDPEEGLMHLIRTTGATHLVVSIGLDSVTDTDTFETIQALLQRCPCNVVVGRRMLAPQA